MATSCVACSRAIGRSPSRAPAFGRRGCPGSLPASCRWWPSAPGRPHHRAAPVYAHTQAHTRLSRLMRPHVCLPCLHAWVAGTLHGGTAGPGGYVPGRPHTRGEEARTAARSTEEREQGSERRPGASKKRARGARERGAQGKLGSKRGQARQQTGATALAPQRRGPGTARRPGRD